MTIEVVAEKGSGGPTAPRLRFRDTGEGMPPEVLEHAFEPFFTTKRAGKGTGLGLATVYGIVVQSGGTVTAESEPGAGTTFEISLPSAPAPESAADEAGPGAAPLDARPAVLVVEAQEVLRGLVVRALSEAGDRALGAADLDEGLRVASREGPVDLVLSDVATPEAGGIARADRIRAALPGAKVILMAEADARTPEADGVVRKPFRLEDLVRAARVARGDRR